MKATDLLVLPAGTILRQADTVEPSISKQLNHNPGDFILTRPGSRGNSLLLNAAAGELLQQFQQPRTLGDAVVNVVKLTGCAPEQLLSSVLPLVVQLRRRRLLVVAGSDESRVIEPTLAESSTFSGVRVIECVHLFEDVEVYRVIDHSGRHCALKILRPHCQPTADAGLYREIEILERLAGVNVPRVLAVGDDHGRRFLLTSWCAGSDVLTVAQNLRKPPASGKPREIAFLCVRIVRAYATVHQRSILHGDVHPGNIKINSDGSVTLLDFALGASVAGDDGLPPLGRGGIAEYIEPEYCRAVVAATPAPPATVASEQYALGALCFRLLTGTHYLHFHFQQESWLSQVIHESPRTFLASGSAPWPAVERVLARALSKDPEERFPAVAEFADELERAIRTSDRPSNPPSARRQFAEEVARRFSTKRKGIPHHLVAGTRNTVNDGAAGIAYMYYRLAGIRDDARCLATADLWSTWGRAEADRRELMRDQPAGFVPDSILHGRAGIECVDALVRHAAGDRHGMNAAVGEFLSCRAELPSWDLAFGNAGAVLASATLLDVLTIRDQVRTVQQTRDAVTTNGDDRLRHGHAALRRAERAGSIAAKSTGLAHGGLGVAYAALRWYESTGRQSPWLAATLDELASRPLGLAHSVSRTADGTPSEVGPARRASWCQGTGGHLLLWTIADHCFPTRGFDSLAESAANLMWADRDTATANGSLCCGYAGRSYALLAHFRRTGDPRWLSRAETLCERAVTLAGRSTNRAGLFQGDIGIALLAWDLTEPEGSAMPLLENENWRSG